MLQDVEEISPCEYKFQYQNSCGIMNKITFDVSPLWNEEVLYNQVANNGTICTEVEVKT